MTFKFENKGMCPIFVEFTSKGQGLSRTNIRNSLDADKPEKLIKIYRFYRAEEDNQ